MQCVAAVIQLIRRPVRIHGQAGSLNGFEQAGCFRVERAHSRIQCVEIVCHCRDSAGSVRRAEARDDMLDREVAEDFQRVLPAIKIGIAYCRYVMGGYQPASQQCSGFFVKYGDVAWSRRPSGVDNVKLDATDANCRRVIENLRWQNQACAIHFGTQLFLELLETMRAACFHQIERFTMSGNACTDLLESASAEHKLPDRVGEYDEFDRSISDGADCFRQLLAVPIRNSGVHNDDAR